MSKNIWRGALTGLSPVVLGINIFVIISLFIDWRPFIQETTQKLYFVFGVIVLYLLSLFTKPKRILTDWRIVSFALWAMFLMFWHSQIWVDSVTYRYLNFYMMSEGFVHVLAAILFYKLIYEYVDELPAVYVALAVYIGRGFFIKSLTPIFTVAICSLIWCAVKKYWNIAFLIIFYIVFFISFNTHYIWLKWQARFFTWPHTIREIMQHPFLGTGFDKNIMQNMVIGPHGWCYRHQDFLNVTKDLGILALGLICIFLFGFIKRFKFELLDILCLGTLIIGCFQTSWYFPRFSIIAVSLFSLWRIKCRQEKF